MAYNTENVLTDLGGKGIPQFFDPSADAYAELLGKSGVGPKYIPVDTDGNPIDFANQTTLAAVLTELQSILAKIIAAPATEAKQDTGNTHLSDIKTAVEGTLDVQLTGSSIQVPADLQSHDLLRATALPAYDAKTYQWLSSDVVPTPAAADRVFGVEVNTATHEAVVKYWNGTAWADLA